MGVGEGGQQKLRTRKMQNQLTHKSPIPHFEIKLDYGLAVSNSKGKSIISRVCNFCPCKYIVTSHTERETAWLRPRGMANRRTVSQDKLYCRDRLRVQCVRLARCSLVPTARAYRSCVVAIPARKARADRGQTSLRL